MPKKKGRGGGRGGRGGRGANADVKKADNVVVATSNSKAPEPEPGAAADESVEVAPAPDTAAADAAAAAEAAAKSEKEGAAANAAEEAAAAKAAEAAAAATAAEEATEEAQPEPAAVAAAPPPVRDRDHGPPPVPARDLPPTPAVDVSVEAAPSKPSPIRSRSGKLLVIDTAAEPKFDRAQVPEPGQELGASFAPIRSRSGKLLVIDTAAEEKFDSSQVPEPGQELGAIGSPTDIVPPAADAAPGTPTWSPRVPTSKSTPSNYDANPKFDGEADPDKEQSHLSFKTAAHVAVATAPYVPPKRTSVPPPPGAQPKAEVHLTRVHEVDAGLFGRNYTFYTLQYTFNLLPAMNAAGHTAECDRRYSEFEAFHEKVSSKNFVGLEGLTPSELAAHFPEKTMWKNSDEIVAERKMGFQTYLDSMAKHSGSNTDVRDLLRVFLMGDA